MQWNDFFGAECTGGFEEGVRDDVQIHNYRTKELYFQIRTGCHLRQVESLILWTLTNSLQYRSAQCLSIPDTTFLCVKVPTFRPLVLLIRVLLRWRIRSIGGKIDKRKSKYVERHVSPYHFVHHWRHMVWSLSTSFIKAISYLPGNTHYAHYENQSVDVLWRLWVCLWVSEEMQTADCSVCCSTW